MEGLNETEKGKLKGGYYKIEYQNSFFMMGTNGGDDGGGGWCINHGDCSPEMNTTHFHQKK